MNSVDRRRRSELLAHAAPLPFRLAEVARQEPKVHWKKPAAGQTAGIEFARFRFWLSECQIINALWSWPKASVNFVGFEVDLAKLLKLVSFGRFSVAFWPDRIK